MRAGFMGRLQSTEEQDFRLSELDRRYLRVLIRYLRPYLGRMIGAVSAMVAASAVTLALPYLAKIAVDEHIVVGDFAGLIVVAAVYAALSAGRWIATYLQTVLSGRIGQDVVFTLRRDLHASVLRQSLSFFRKERVGEIMSRVTNDVNAISEFATTGIVHVLNDLLTLVGVLAVMFILDVRLAVVTCLSIPVIGFGVQYLGKKMREAYGALRREVAAVNVGVQQGVSGMRVTQSMSREQAGVEQFEGLSLRNMQANLRTSFFFAMLFPLMSVSNMLSTVLVLVYGGTLVGRGALTIGTLVAFFGYINRFFGPVREMALVYNTFQGAAASLQRIGEYLETESDVRPAADPVSLGVSVRGNIDIEHVSFRYPAVTQDRAPALQDVTLRLAPESVVALVGPTGAGKTTLANLLARLYDPDEGVVRIDGVDLRSVPAEELRRTVSLVPQDVYLFPDTIAENIRYGRIEADEEEIREAARLTQAHRFIEELPDGYETMVGESGARLSGGQKQLVSLARTLLADPRILILDEPTANVDVLTESLIQQGLSALTSGRTTIIIAHRFSTVREADSIVLLEDGRITAVGSHDELLASSDSYRELYEKQWITR